ncbi:hypothetical protein Nepgr_011540 [Nepenthes gracilis]|uniref:Uncharacterized protein n=1 Tax=Nepenthes gracilis TaxID=150966 RepID=A0AAD3SF16_NEPGR|nr:hypothetical protein Nepgr_011540 [Nepenthes gracilis]
MRIPTTGSALIPLGRRGFVISIPAGPGGVLPMNDEIAKGERRNLQNAGQARHAVHKTRRHKVAVETFAAPEALKFGATIAAPVSTLRFKLFQAEAADVALFRDSLFASTAVAAVVFFLVYDGWLGSFPLWPCVL